MLAERGEVLRGVKAVSERGDGGLEGAVGDGDLERGKRVEHLCGVLTFVVRKPGAFAAYRYREDLFPSLVFRRAFDALRASRGDRADVEYVRIIHLAASTTEHVV